MKQNNKIILLFGTILFLLLAGSGLGVANTMTTLPMRSTSVMRTTHVSGGSAPVRITSSYGGRSSYTGNTTYRPHQAATEYYRPYSATVYAVGSISPSSSSSTSYAPSGRRRSHSDGNPGDYEGQKDGEGYVWDGEEWVAPSIGDTRTIDGVAYYWNGTAWVPLDDQRELGTPVGATPWLFMLLLACAYGYVRTMRRKRITIKSTIQ